MISSMPTKKEIGLLNDIKRPAYLKNPIAVIPNILVMITEIIAYANVVLRSLVGARRNGKKPCPPSPPVPIVPTPGIRPSQFESNIKIKKEECAEW